MKSGIHFIIFTVIIGTFSLNVATASVVTDGLVSYWTFDKEHVINETVKDVWGDNNGIISGNPKVVPGHVGEALKFDGVDDFVNLTTLGDFGKQMGTFTFEAWIKTSNKTDWMTLINTHGAECPYWGIQLNGLKSKDVLQFKEGWIYFINSLLRKEKRGCESFLMGSSFNSYFGEWRHIVYINEHKTEEGKAKEFIYVDTMSRGKGQTSFGNEWTSFPFTEPVVHTLI